MEGHLAIGGRCLLSRDSLQTLIDLLAGSHRVVGPTLRDGAIVYDDLSRLEDLPIGWTDRQEAGHYHLERRTDEALFGYVVGPQSWKRFLHPPVETLWTATREAGDLRIIPAAPDDSRFAFIGVRACEIQAIAVQDQVLIKGDYADSAYARRRRAVFIVAVNCGQAGGTCFCASMGHGPGVESGFDLALTELQGEGRHEFLVEVGSDAGAEILAQLPWRPADDESVAAARAVVERTTGQMGRSLDVVGLKEALQDNLNHPHWEDVAKRCLNCGNCTMVCPTCFCTGVDDTSELDGKTASRVRHWDSCFTLDFSYLHGGSVRNTTLSRYRQWITHKLANWIDQFGTSGCVGCGRCITWCPVGIDLTAEAAALRADASPDQPSDSLGGDHGRA